MTRSSSSAIAAQNSAAKVGTPGLAHTVRCGLKLEMQEAGQSGYLANVAQCVTLYVAWRLD